MQTGLSPNVLERAVTYYHELLRTLDFLNASRQMLDDRLGASKLIFGGRRLCPYLRPHFVTEEDWYRVSAIGETVFGALQKVKDAAVDDDSLLDELGITEIERELVKIDPGYSHVSPTTDSIRF